ncbi:hypothetical protein GF360_00115 [candidate division WWE3 bacterium]|nr:hypothetical protein [candidate division WWE3 bacterium]
MLNNLRKNLNNLDDSTKTETTRGGVSLLRQQLPLILLIIFTFLRVRTFCDGDFITCSSQKQKLKNSLATEKTIEEKFPKFAKALNQIRNSAITRAHKYLPSPASELLLGMTIGIDHFHKLPKFKEMLLKTGTIHVVVVSGYNISLVYTLVWALLGSFYNRTRLIVGAIVALFYAFLSGFDPPVIRSWIMGSIAYLGKYYGRSFPTLRVSVVSGLAMVLWQPAFLFSLSFQLSFMATLSLVLFSAPIENLGFATRVPAFLQEDLVATVAAQVLVWPLISFYFGRVSLISLLVNALVLWTVPLATVLGGVFLLLFFVGDFMFLSKILAFLVYIPADIFADTVAFFSRFPFAQIEVKISPVFLVTYYLVLFVIAFKLWRKSEEPVLVQS